MDRAVGEVARPIWLQRPLIKAIYTRAHKHTHTTSRQNEKAERFYQRALDVDAANIYVMHNYAQASASLTIHRPIPA